MQLSVRKYNLETYQRQKMLETAVADSKSIFDAAYGLFRAHHTGESIRSIGVRVSSLVPLGMSQCSLFEDAARGKRPKSSKRRSIFCAANTAATSLTAASR